ncbi:MAG: hypothetical protein AMXMBFR33_61070 [Candidatus Xenobia bacterium]
MLSLPVVNGPRPMPAVSGPAVLALGFRPFFLLGSWYGVLTVLVWVAIFLGWLSFRPGLSPMLWHGHEMLFGFTAAIIAGFLLTAVPNWTGIPTPRGALLGGLVALWLLGRGLILSSAVPAILAAAVDLAFLPALAAALAYPLVKAGKPHNLVFLPVLGVFTLSNGLVWAEALGRPGTAALGLELGLLCILQLVALIGGRVIPFFIRAALPESPARSWPWVERLALASLPLVALLEALGLSLGAICWAAAIPHVARLAGWFDRRLIKVPLLWVLYLGYAWLPVGLALKGWARLVGASPFPALHALTVGCIGVMILGMMARVALGHTGRALKPPRAVVAAFGLLLLAAVLRTFGPMLAPGTVWVTSSAVLWALAFGLYGLVYFPILTRPRIDGKPG